MIGLLISACISTVILPLTVYIGLKGMATSFFTFFPPFSKSFDWILDEQPDIAGLNNKQKMYRLN